MAEFHLGETSYRYAARNENSVLVVPASSMDSKDIKGRVRRDVDVLAE